MNTLVNFTGSITKQDAARHGVFVCRISSRSLDVHGMGEGHVREEAMHNAVRGFFAALHESEKIKQEADNARAVPSL